MKNLNLNVEPNTRTGGYYCRFSHDGKNYFASLCIVMGGFSECMVFYDGQWSDLYCARHIPVTAEQLEDCIQEFVKSLSETL